MPPNATTAAEYTIQAIYEPREAKPGYAESPSSPSVVEGESMVSLPKIHTLRLHQVEEAGDDAVDVSTESDQLGGIVPLDGDRALAVPAYVVPGTSD